jgi:aspartate ammonia-lyase
MKAIVAACDELVVGRLHEQFVVDVIQGGAGTSTNMNANEVIANRALEIMGHQRGEYNSAPQRTRQHEPVDQRRLSHGAQAGHLCRHLPPGGRHGLPARAFERKADEFADVLKMGRTQLQDAVPMTLGQEFSTYAVMLGEDEERLREAALLIREINLGATAIGTGINAHPDYAAWCAAAWWRSAASRWSPPPT